MSSLTIHDLPPEVAQALERAEGRERRPLNQIVIDLLRKGLNLPGNRKGRRGNGLAALAGTWSEEDLAAFEAATAHFEP